jgi:thiamine-phosphate pyrophosphorylase
MVTGGTAPPSGADEGFLTRARAAALAGVDLIQIREPHLDGAALFHLVERCVAAVRSTRTRVLVNERIDVALAAHAHGVHLRGHSVSAGRVRAIAPPGFLVGRSVHDVAEVAAVTAGGGLDYLIFGTVFASRTKPDRAAAGVGALEAAVGITTLPILAIGGITPERLGDVARAGAAGWAAIGLFGGPPERLQLTLAQASLAFDTPYSVP